MGVDFAQQRKAPTDSTSMFALHCVRRLVHPLRLLLGNGGLCIECGRFSPDVCSRCLEKPPLKSDVAGLPALHNALHKGSLSRCIHRLKYEETPALGYSLGYHFGAKLRHHETLPRTEVASSVFVPIPLHFERLQERGYNQSALVARGLVAGIGGGRVATDLLLRVKATQAQAKLSEGERRSNLEQAFRIRGEKPRAHLWLVDDVCTTGATVTAAIRALRDGGVEPEGVLTLSCSVERGRHAKKDPLPVEKWASA